MKKLVIGNMGYVGPPVIRQLRRSYHDATIIGMDIGYYSTCFIPQVTLSKLRFDQYKEWIAGVVTIAIPK